MIILDCEQGESEWLQARAGLVTASLFKEIITPLGKKTTGARPHTYMNVLLGEWLSGKPSDKYISKAMIRGTELEPQARDSYAFLADCDPEQVGLVYLDDKRLVSCSPDALIGENGGWECKCPLDHNHIATMLKNVMPNEHIPQVQGCLWICEREWWDFMSYHPDMEPMIHRVYRDESYIRTLKKYVDEFIDDMMEKREQLNKMRGAA